MPINTLRPLDGTLYPIRVRYPLGEPPIVELRDERTTVGAHLMSTDAVVNSSPRFGLLKQMVTFVIHYYGCSSDAVHIVCAALGIRASDIDTRTHPGVFALVGLARYHRDGSIKWPFYYRVGSSIQCDWIENTPDNIRKCYRKITQDNLDKYSATASYCVPTIENRCSAVWMLAPILDLRFPTYSSTEDIATHRASGMMTYSQIARYADNEGLEVALVLEDNIYCVLLTPNTSINTSFRKFRNILSYSTDVPSVTGILSRRTEKDNNDTPLYGVELELTTNRSILDVVSSFGEVFGVCKADSSIRGSKRNKAELVTVPATLRYHRKMWTEWFKQDMTEYDQSLDTNNGMHIHIGRKAFYLNDELNHNHLLRFSYFFNNIANRWFIVKCSERSDYEIQGYCNFAPIAFEKTKGKQITRAVKSAANSKMYAVNHTKNHTIEVRIFKGVISFASVMKNLELVDAVLHYTRDCSFRQCNVYGLMHWLEKHTSPSQYRALKMYLKHNVSMDDARIVTNFLEGIVTLDGRRKYDNLTDLQRSYIAVSMPQEAHKLGDYEVYFRDEVSPCLSLDSILMARKEG